MSAVRQAQLLALLEELPERERALLDLVARFRLVQSSQVERLFFTDSSNQGAAARHCRRQLARLVELGLLHRLERRIGGVRAGSAGHVYALAPAGRRLQALIEGDDRASDRGVHEPGLPFLRHTLAVTELYVRLREAERTGTVELLGYDTEPDCWRAYTLASGAIGYVKPDAFVRLGVEEWEERSFIEIDLGTEGRGDLVRKLKAYQALFRSGREQTERGVFPRVAFLATREPRAAQIARVADSLQLPSGLVVSGPFEQALSILTGASDAEQQR